MTPTPTPPSPRDERLRRVRRRASQLRWRRRSTSAGTLILAVAVLMLPSLRPPVETSLTTEPPAHLDVVGAPDGPTVDTPPALDVAEGATRTEAGGTPLVMAPPAPPAGAASPPALTDEVVQAPAARPAPLLLVDDVGDAVYAGEADAGDRTSEPALDFVSASLEVVGDEVRVHSKYTDLSRPPGPDSTAGGTPPYWISYRGVITRGPAVIHAVVDLRTDLPPLFRFMVAARKGGCADRFDGCDPQEAAYYDDAAPGSIHQDTSGMTVAAPLEEVDAALMQHEARPLTDGGPIDMSHFWVLTSHGVGTGAEDDPTPFQGVFVKQNEVDHGYGGSARFAIQ